MPAADLILTNAHVITVDDKQPFAEMVAVKNGRIAYVGEKASLLVWQGSGTRVIDCGGQTVVPGFIDAHCHIFSFARKLISLDLGIPSIKSIADIQAAVKQRVGETKPGEWITGTDYNEFYLQEKRHPTRWELDEVSPLNPVVVSHRSLHAAVLNSQALERAGINVATPEPPGAFIGRRVTDGEPDGLLVEMLGYIRGEVMPPLQGEQLENGVRLANDFYLSQGVTSLQDATFVNDLKRWRYQQYFKTEGLLKSRVYMMTGVKKLPDFLNERITFGAGDEFLRLGGIKIVPSMLTDKQHTQQAEYTPYTQDGAGIVWESLQPPESELLQMVLAAHGAGFQIAIHAIQSKLVEAIVGVYAKAQKQLPNFALRRHRIEHCAECPPRLLERIKRLGLVIVSHPGNVYYSGDRFLDTVDAATVPYLYPMRSFVASGLAVAAASDSPVMPANPLMGIYGGVTRTTTTGQKISPEQAVAASDVLKMYTLNAAYASHEEKLKGSIAVGKLADFAVLSADPTTVSPEKIKNISVKMTILGGEIVWES
jgi:predicted amidohydrolase YtcJ